MEQVRERPQLIAMLDYIRDGDIVVVTELERLGRNNKELTEVMDEIKLKGATLEVLNLPTLRGIEDDNLRRLLNNLILELYKYQAQAERERIKERQAQGIAIAKAQGKYKGRRALFSADLYFLGNMIKHNTNSSRELVEQLQGNDNVLSTIPYRELFNRSTLEKASKN